MHRSCALALGAAVLAAPAAAQAASPPAGLPAVKRSLTAAATTAKLCSRAGAGGRGIASATFRAPMSGYLTVRLSGRGDWDLLLRRAGGGRIGASQGFGGREVVQTWVGAGDRLVAQGCRRRGATRSATVAFRLLDVAPPRPDGAPSLVRVQAGRAGQALLERLGFDVTHAQSGRWADVVLSGAGQLQRLRALKLPFATRIANLTSAYAAARAADRAYGARVGESPLPSGRTSYRTYEDYQAELKKLVADNPGLVRPVSFGKSFQGREISGVEIARNVDRADGRPVFFLMGVHHAREWPSGEAAMEFAHMLVSGRSGARISALLGSERVVVLPIVNVDGFISSRGALDPGDTLTGQDETVTLVEGVAPPGGVFAYRRKNCDGEIGPGEVPCELTWGVDNNRNYGNLWGGPGSSSDVTSQSYHGPAPRSEPETQAVWNYARTHHVTTLISLHNVAALVLRPPGLHYGGKSPDEEAMKALGDAMADAAGYTSQYSFQLYDTAGTTEDDTYAATGGYGYTIEIGPEGGNFHMPYETGFVKEWTGDNDKAKGGGGLREALLLGAEAAARPSSHAILAGTAPAGAVLRLSKEFETQTSPWCAKGVEPVVTLAPTLCLTGEQEPLTLKDKMDTTTTVPASGAFEWHIGQSTRPFVGGGAVIEQVKDLSPPLATFSGSPGAPGSKADHAFTIPEGAEADKVRVALSPTLPEDYDLEVFRKEGDQLKSVGTSGNLPGSGEEVLIEDPRPGEYVARVEFWAGLTGAYELKVSRVVATREVTTGRKEAYTLTCEKPAGNVLERHSLVVDRGQVVDLRLGCGAGASSDRDGKPLGGDHTAPPPAIAPSVDGRPVPTGRRPASKPSKRLTRVQKVKRCRAKARKIRNKTKRARALKRCGKVRKAPR